MHQDPPQNPVDFSRVYRDDRMKCTDTPTMLLQKKLHRIALQMPEASSGKNGEDEANLQLKQLGRILDMLVDTFQMEKHKLPPQEACEVAQSLLEGMAERLQPIKIRFVNEN